MGDGTTAGLTPRGRSVPSGGDVGTVGRGLTPPA